MAEHAASEYLVERPVLSRRLEGALSVPLTLLVAQAGAGKTVLLTQWAAQHPALPFVWIDVEAADDDPVRFARRLLTGLADVRPEVERLGRLAVLGGRGLGTPLLQSLPSELESFPETVIVLDDLHHLTNSTLLADIGRLVAALPANVHIVLSTRVDPPIPWSGLRLRSRLLEIRQADLAMSRQESADLLERITRRDLPSETVDLLVTRTEGWAASLQLAGLAMRFRETSDDFVAEFSGSDRLIAEYLTEEVLDALSEDDRGLLLRMAPLDTMTAELVDHVLERSDAQRLFERLEHESMFLVGMDSSRTRFRFHHLFRDLLRYHVRAEHPEEEKRLLGRAADFHLERGEPAPAVEYLLRAGDWGRALDTITVLGSDVFEHGEMRTVARWIMAVPEPARADRLDTSLELGILVGMQGEATRAVDILRRVASEPRATVGQRTIAEAWTSATVQWNAHPEESVRAAERAMALLDANPGAQTPDLMHLTSPELLRTLATGSLGRALFLAGEPAGSEAWLARALDTEGISYPPFRIGVLGSQALLRSWNGRTADAELLAAEAIQTATTSGLLSHPVMADAYLAQALLAHERGQPDAAAAPLRDALVRATANHRTQLIWIAAYIEAAICAADGRFDEALELTDLSRHDAPSAPAPAILDRLMGLRMSVLRRTGRSMQSLRLGDGLHPTPSVHDETIAAWLATGDVDAAVRLLGETTDPPMAARPRDDIRHSILQAWAAELAGTRHMALDLVGAALDLAEPHGLVTVFLASDAAVLDLIDELAPARGGLAEAISSRRGQVERPNANAQLPEPLTERELEILAYLPDHSTSAELARLCFVSINTVKTHTAHIYRKLGVSGRSAAVAKARELGLLSSVSRPDRSRA